jgi:hypothetical protein
MNQSVRIIFGQIVIWTLSICPKVIQAQDYLNAISVKTGFVQPVGAYAQSVPSHDAYFGGLQLGTTWGVEWKSRMLIFDLFQESLSNSFFNNSGGESPFGLMLSYDQSQFQWNVKNENQALKNYDEVTRNADVKAQRINLGITYTMDSDYDGFYSMLKLGGGIGQMNIPALDYEKNQLSQYRQAAINVNTLNVNAGFDLVYDINAIKFQLHYDLVWMRPEIKTTVQDFVNGGMIYRNFNEIFWSHGIGISIGYNFY